MADEKYEDVITAATYNPIASDETRAGRHWMSFFLDQIPWIPRIGNHGAKGHLGVIVLDWGRRGFSDGMRKYALKKSHDIRLGSVHITTGRVIR
jgi:hypothetical protein